MQVICANREVERSFEIGCQTEFLAELPGMFLGNILQDEAV